jgi:release factor glutamine methyltransferase
VTTVSAALGWANGVLSEAGIDNGRTDARRIMAAALDVAPERVTLLAYDELDAATEAAFMASIQLRAEGHPVSHLVGGRLFYDRWFVVTPDVLDPRPETETLVATALSEPFGQVLDLGTGSAAIIVTLLAERPDAVGVGVDVSEAALRIAQRNATAHGVDDRLHLEVSDWFASVGGKFDLIVANPPYIAADEMDTLQREVRLHEPRMALTDEADGLSAYRAIIAQAPDHLAPGGRLIVEIGPTQAAAVCAMMEIAGLRNVTVIPDLDGRDRVVIGKMMHFDQSTAR